MDEPTRIADADSVLGRLFPLPAAALPLARWVDVTLHPGGAEVAWALDDSRPGTPGRLALYAGVVNAPEREFPADAVVGETAVGEAPATLRTAPLAVAASSLRPVAELTWQAGGLHLRLTGQGAWELGELLAIAASIPA